MITMRLPWVVLAIALVAALVSCGSTDQSAEDVTSPSGSPTSSVRPTIGPTPAAFTARTPLPSCGSYELGLEALPSQAGRCMTAAVGTTAGAELVLSRPTVEGDAVVTYFRALPGSTSIEVFIDSTKDKFGTRVWSRQMCGGFVNERLDPRDCAEPTEFLARELTGRWLPRQIDGFEFPKSSLDRSPYAVRFLADGTWTGSDGCNAIGGTYTIDPVGTFNATAGPQTLIGCANVPNSEVLTQATKIVLTADLLRFLDTNGRILGDYTPA